MNSNKNQPHVIPPPRAHTRASVSFRFFPSPFTPPPHLFVSQQVRCEGKAFFSFTSSFTLEIWKSSILQKNHIYLFLSRRQLRKMRSFRPKAFTPKSLIHNHLRKMSEEMKAKNGKLFCAHYARARPPHLHPEHRALRLLATRTRRHEIRPPLGVPPVASRRPHFSHKNHRQTCPPPNNSYICSTHT